MSYVTYLAIVTKRNVCEMFVVWAADHDWCMIVTPALALAASSRQWPGLRTAARLPSICPTLAAAPSW